MPTISWLTHGHAEHGNKSSVSNTRKKPSNTHNLNLGPFILVTAPSHNHGIYQVSKTAGWLLEEVIKLLRDRC